MSKPKSKTLCNELFFTTPVRTMPPQKRCVSCGPASIVHLGKGLIFTKIGNLNTFENTSMVWEREFSVVSLSISPPSLVKITSG